MKPRSVQVSRIGSFVLTTKTLANAGNMMSRFNLSLHRYSSMHLYPGTELSSAVDTFIEVSRTTMPCTFQKTAFPDSVPRGGHQGIFNACMSPEGLTRFSPHAYYAHVRHLTSAVYVLGLLQESDRNVTVVFHSGVAVARLSEARIS